MTTDDLIRFLLGALSVSSLVAGLFFLRFWNLSRDRLFAYLWLAFWLMSLNWIALAVIDWGPETRHRAYILRLLAFIHIIIGVIEKNRRERKPARNPQRQNESNRTQGSSSS